MEIGKTAEQDLRDHQAQNRVSQKLQLLIVFFPRAVHPIGLAAFQGLLIRQRAMGQRFHQQLRLAEGITQCCLKRVGSRLCHRNFGCPFSYCIA
jgi:hypothetical protein